jgi:hypothetical protein
MALPPLLVLGALLMSADPVFAGMIHDVFRIDLEPLLEHVVFAAVIAWLTAGYLRAFLVRDDVVMDRLRVPRPAFAAAEVSVALWILNLLFIAFMAVQLRYLFGGSGLVEVTAGLSYAEYARRGFFELVATAVLVVPILLLGDWAASSDTRRSRRVLRATMLVLVALLFGRNRVRLVPHASVPGRLRADGAAALRQRGHRLARGRARLAGAHGHAGPTRALRVRQPSPASSASPRCTR